MKFRIVESILDEAFIDSEGKYTDFGTGKVYDSGCDAGTTDIYTNW